MKPHLRYPLLYLTTVLAMAGVLSAADPGAKYQPQLAPVFSAGETFTYKAVADYQGLLRITKSTKKPQKDATGKTKTVRTDNILHNDQSNFSAKLVADSALAKAVFKNGSLQEAEFLVKQCVLSDDKDNTVELLAPGTIIGARKQADGQVAFAINGKAPDADLATHLSILIPMGDEHATANDLLGAPGAIPVGTSWAVNEKAMLNSDLRQVFPGVDRVAGSVVLRSAEPDSAGAMRTTVTSTYRLGDVRPPFPDDEIASPSEVYFEIVATAPAAHGSGQYDLKSSVNIHHAGYTGDIAIGMSETDMEVRFMIDQEVHYVLGGGGKPAAALASAPPIPEVAPLPPGMSSAPVLRPAGPNFHALPKTTTPATDNPPAVSAPQPASPPTAPVQAGAPPLVIPDGSPFSGAQDLPGAPANAR